MLVALARAATFFLGIPVLIALYMVAGATAQAQELRVFERVDPASPMAKLAIETYQNRLRDLPPQRSLPDLLGYVRMNVGIFRPTADNFAREFVFNLADTLDIKVDIPGGLNIRTQLAASASPGMPGTTNWTGQVREIKDSSVTITYFEGGVTGKISMPALSLKFRKAGDDVYAIEKINERSYPNEAHPLKRSDIEPMRPGEDARDTSQHCATDPSIKRARVLILYSEAAEKYVGSATDFIRTMGNIVGEANLVLKNSKILLELEVAALAKVSIARDANSSVYLNTLAQTASVAALRKQHKAQIVSLLDDFPAEYTYCGVGFIARLPPLAKEGYNVVDIGCAGDKYSLIHEIGHNLGAGHDKAHGDGLFSYSYGMQWPNKFRSVMAYSCDSSAACDRIPRFTNPGITFSGETIGHSDSADNARTINQLRCYVADWKID